jgi:hypothetical protein
MQHEFAFLSIKARILCILEGYALFLFLDFVLEIVIFINIIILDYILRWK